jgi:hypothetical protein
MEKSYNEMNTKKVTKKGKFVVMKDLFSQKMSLDEASFYKRNQSSFYIFMKYMKVSLI